MKIELSHDALARRIYEKASAEDKSRLRVTAFIRNRFAFYQENRSLLRTDDLSYIRPYLKTLDLSPEEEAFIKRSRRVAQAKKTSVILVIVIAFMTMAIFYMKAETRKTQLELAMSSLDNVRVTLMRSDSIQQLNREQLAAMTAALRVAYDSLKISQDSLRQVQDSLRIVNARLAEANNELASRAKRAEEQARQAVSAQNQAEQARAATQRELERVKTTVRPNTNISPNTNTNTSNEASRNKWESRILSGQAALAFQRDDRALAFRLARQAFELDNSNQEAYGVLRWIQSPPDAFSRKAPWPRVNQNDARQIIEKFRTFGTLSPAERKTYIGE